MPTTPFPAPRKGLSLATLDPLRARINCLTSHGGLTGVPQVSLPGASAGGLPVGLSIVGARGSDATLVAVARAMEEAR
jgi:amidase